MHLGLKNLDHQGVANYMATAYHVSGLINVRGLGKTPLTENASVLGSAEA